MHKEILTTEQVELLSLVNRFSPKFGLVGGTAIALWIGHRKSIDFDLFSLEEFDNYQIKRKISQHYRIERIFRDETGQYTLLMRGVRFTFLHYPYKIEFSEKFDHVVKMPDLITLAAMKSFALGRRTKWKDYVDLYFILRDHSSIEAVSRKARQIFGREFNEKSFRAQLIYFKDIDYSDKVIFTKGFAVSDAVIKKGLKEFSLQ